MTGIPVHLPENNNQRPGTETESAPEPNPLSIAALLGVAEKQQTPSKLSARVVRENDIMCLLRERNGRMSVDELAESLGVSRWCALNALRPMKLEKKLSVTKNLVHTYVSRADQHKKAEERRRRLAQYLLDGVPRLTCEIADFLDIPSKNVSKLLVSVREEFPQIKSRMVGAALIIWWKEHEEKTDPAG